MCIVYVTHVYQSYSDRNTRFSSSGIEEFLNNSDPYSIMQYGNDSKIRKFYVTVTIV